jgi:hypothetical protein
MTELTEQEAKQVASAMRPQRRPLLIALAANLVMSGALLGVPYVRGRILARETREHYVAFVQCIIGGEPAANPGLSLPRGEREHYAAKVLFANSDWPLSCRPALQRLRPPDATFLWPSLKSAGLDLRAAVDLVDKELVTLAKRRAEGTGRVPQKPLDALRRLQAASVLFARAGGAKDDIDNDSIVLSDKVTGLAAPARLPLMIGETHGLLGWSDSGVLELLTFDSHSLAYLRVDGGKVDRQRVRRNSFLRGVSRAGSTAYLAWAMPEAKCNEREDHCAARPTGLARYDKGGSELEEPTWKLPGHPAERLDRSLSISETGRVDFLRRSSARGGIEWIRTHLPLLAAGTPAGEQKPTRLDVEAEATVVDLPDEPATKSGASSGAAAAAAVSGANRADGNNAAAPSGTGGPEANKDKPQPVAMVLSSATLVHGEPVSVLRATQTAAGVEASLTLTSQPTRTLSFETVPGEKPWTAACSAGADRFVAYGSSSELRVQHYAEGPNAQPLVAQHIELGTPLDPEDSGGDRLRLLCEDGRAQLLFVSKDLSLQELSCDSKRCSDTRVLTKNVAEFDAVRRRGLTMIAYQQGPVAPTIKLLRLDEKGNLAGNPTVVGPCWDPLGGLCGRPILISDPQRTALLTRDGPDVLALETTNDGRTFATLSGIPVNRAPDSGTLTPMQQHRKRKGIED